MGIFLAHKKSSHGRLGCKRLLGAWVRIGEDNMQLERLRMVGVALLSDEALDGVCRYQSFFVEIESRWHRNGLALVDDAALVRLLSDVKVQSRHRNGAAAKSVFFPFAEFGAVFEFEFQAAPRTATRGKVERAIAKCVDYANKAFDATHDGLTGLLNRKGFETEIAKALDEFRKAPVVASQSLAGLQAEPAIGIVALDIDHFKQVNDTYGHLYGDLVLKCFARRVEEAAVRMQKASVGKLSVRVARIGGEEFFVCIAGALSQAELSRCAEVLRLAIADGTIPSDTEWSMETPQGMQLPHAADRRVTASVGVSSILPIKHGGMPVGFVESLRAQADAALLRAKAGGRNVVRSYPDILSKLGRVVVHKPEMSVVVIDIGKNVSVMRGQEFMVFHPEFDGGRPLVVSDGRSTKRLGTIPRLAHGRIVAIDVQPEISFCKVVQGQHFPEGSSLELVPMGAITHILNPHALLGSPVAVEDPSERIGKLIGQWQDEPFATVVFTLDNAAELSRSRGDAFVNDVLAQIYRAIHETLPPGTQVLQIPQVDFACTFRVKDESSALMIVSSAVDEAHRITGRAAVVGAGMFVFPPVAKSKMGDKSKLTREHALSYARFAALKAARDGGRAIEVFSAETARDLLHAARSLGKYEEVVFDYERMISMGVMDAQVENQAAICYAQRASPEFSRAIDLVSNAIRLYPSLPTFYANLGSFEYQVGMRDRAHSSFEKAVATDRKWVMPEIYTPVRAMAMFHQYVKAPETVDSGVLKALLKAASGMPAAAFDVVSPQDVSSALEAVSKGGVVSNETLVSAPV